MLRVIDTHFKALFSRKIFYEFTDEKIAKQRKHKLQVTETENIPSTWIFRYFEKLTSLYIRDRCSSMKLSSGAELVTCIRNYTYHID